MAEPMPTVTTWCGRPIEELTREELIAALDSVICDYHSVVSMLARYVEISNALLCRPLATARAGAK